MISASCYITGLKGTVILVVLKMKLSYLSRFTQLVHSRVCVTCRPSSYYF